MRHYGYGSYTIMCQFATIYVFHEVIWWCLLKNSLLHSLFKENKNILKNDKMQGDYIRSSINENKNDIEIYVAVMGI